MIKVRYTVLPGAMEVTCRGCNCKLLAGALAEEDI